MLKDFLQGKPFKHPLHPMLVHLPIGLFTLSLLFDLAGLVFTTEDWLVEAAFYTLAFGVFMAVIAAIPGLVDWADLRADHPGKQFATTHMLLNLIAVGLNGVNLGLRAGALNEPQTPTVPLILSLASVGLVYVSGYLGGLLIYDQGISPGRHRRQTDTSDRTIRVSAASPNGGFVAIAEASRLGNQEILRAEVDGKAMAIANLDGQFYAFQEFCTHRYGPLSEGRFVKGQVQCPWHGSCFDVRTGQVTHGPAKVDLKTYEVQVRDGQIWVRVLRPERRAPRRCIYSIRNAGEDAAR
ncbi:MAG TPA: DUF2231 domain-containing protein [Anaerolineae bacterium]|nr:DUF2231 domain-containing protein [Anaerolineae bacterium]